MIDFDAAYGDKTKDELKNELKDLRYAKRNATDEVKDLLYTVRESKQRILELRGLSKEYFQAIKFIKKKLANG